MEPCPLSINQHRPPCPSRASSRASASPPARIHAKPLPPQLCYFSLSAQSHLTYPTKHTHTPLQPSPRNMMLTTSFFSHQVPHHSPYTPPRSSPLSERSGNVQPRIFDFTMSSPIKEQTAAPHRTFKPNPVMQTRDAATKRRRDMFFKRVQNNRDDKKWESRGEQVCGC